jgi:hypothetical protein
VAEDPMSEVKNLHVTVKDDIDEDWQHTPGPWFDRGQITRADHRRPREVYYGDHNIESQYVRVATVARDGPGDREGAANARLVAAAPDMLAALDRALDDMNSAGQFGLCVCERTKQQIRKALVKATREEAR